MRRYLQITLGVFITTSGYAFVTVPMKIINGGITSLAMILERLIFIDVGILVTVLKLGMLVLCGLALGLRYLKGSLYSGIMYVLLFALLHGLSDLTGFAFRGPLWLAVPLGALMVGTGYGICIANEATEVGFDAVALIIHRRFPKIGVAVAMNALSVLVLLSGLLVFHWKAVVAGIVFSVIQSFTLNHVLTFFLKQNGIGQEG